MTGLGAGDTPLIPSTRYNDLYYKLEHLNPTGSFKDRGSAQIIADAVADGIDTLHIVSSGNAAVSLATYAAAHDLSCVCHLPRDTMQGKKDLITSLGADLREYSGSYEDIHHQVTAMDLDGWNVTPGTCDTAMHGYRAIAEEITDDITPDTVVVPCGNGTLLAGMWKGFQETDSAPRMVGIQISGAAPIKTAIAQGTDYARVSSPASSSAEGIVASESLDCSEAVNAIAASEGCCVTVPESAVNQGMAALARDEGIICEPTSGVVHSVAVNQPGVTVAVITGSGLKATGQLKQSLLNSSRHK